jgi:hypothetical protein
MVFYPPFLVEILQFFPPHNDEKPTSMKVASRCA